MPATIHRYKKTRIAPTPSGFLHLGNVLSFAITTTLARRSGAEILLRIDDLDRMRTNKQYLQDIFDTLNFLGIPWDEGPRNVKEFEQSYSQLHRMDIYHEAIDELLNKPQLFACTCTRRELDNGSTCNCFEKRIPLTTENASWRFITDDTAIEVKGYNGQMIRTALPAGMRNFILRKKDGFPAYQLTSVVDDIFYGVDLIVRGDDLWPSTLAQHQLALALGKDSFDQIAFYHHPLVVEPSGKKLSKSAGATSVRYLRESGKSPADIFALIADMAGIKEKVTNWQQLGEVMLDRKI